MFINISLLHNFGVPMNELVEKLFNLYPFFCCIKNSYERFCAKEDVRKFKKLTNRQIPQLITDVYNTACLLIKIIDVSLAIYPIGTNKYSQNVIATILKKTYWDIESMNQISSELHISSGTFLRYKTAGKEIVFKNLAEFLNCQFKISTINFNLVNENKIQTLIKLYNKQDLFGECDKVKKAANAAYNTFFYHSFINCYLKEIKNYQPNGRYYSTITKIIIEHPEYEMKNLIKSKYKYFSEKYTYRRIKTFVNESTDLLGILIFSINYLSLDEGLFFEKKL